MENLISISTGYEKYRDINLSSVCVSLYSIIIRSRIHIKIKIRMYCFIQHMYDSRAFTCPFSGLWVNVHKWVEWRGIYPSYNDHYRDRSMGKGASKCFNVWWGEMTANGGIIGWAWKQIMDWVWWKCWFIKASTCTCAWILVLDWAW